MRLRCPACHAESSLETFMAADAARAALVRALRFPAPLATLTIQYLSMFRSERKYLSFDRVETLLAELFVMVDAGQVTLNHSTRAAPLEHWRQCLEQMVELRSRAQETPPQGNLRLPLKTHGYLVAMVFAMGEKAAAKVEQQHEQQARQGRREEAPRNNPIVELSSKRERIRSNYQLALAEHAQCLEELRATGMPDEAANAFLASAEDIRNSLLEKRRG